MNLRRAKGGLILAVLLLLAHSSEAGHRGLAAQQGIINFGRVSQSLYRGAQPDAQALKNLKRLGIKTIINLRMPGDSWPQEESLARADGILYTNVPLRGWGRPLEAQVTKALRLIETLPAPVFIHCQHGCDRTGTIVACYRIMHDKWSREAALREANAYGLSHFERGMRRFVFDFAASNSQEAPFAKVAVLR